MYNLTEISSYSFPPRNPSETYVLDIHRTPAGIAAISSDQKLTLLDPARLAQGPVRQVTTDHGNLATLKVIDDAVVCTAGENGRVAVWDLRVDGEKGMVAKFQGSEAPIISMACSSSTGTIAVATELQHHTASIHLWDVRNNPLPKAKYTEVHSDDITSLSFHPSQPNILLSGSTDGLVSVHDTSIADEDDMTLQTFNHNASIHHAAFLAGQGSKQHVLALSHDERCALYDLVAPDSLEQSSPTRDASHDFGDLRSALSCQYVANVAPKADGSGAIIGVGSQDRESFELVYLARDGDRWGFDRGSSVGLPGAHGEEVVRGFCFYDDEQVVFTGGEDGCVKAWRPGQ